MQKLSCWSFTATINLIFLASLCVNVGGFNAAAAENVTRANISSVVLVLPSQMNQTHNVSVIEPLLKLTTEKGNSSGIPALTGFYIDTTNSSQSAASRHNFTKGRAKTNRPRLQRLLVSRKRAEMNMKYNSTRDKPSILDTLFLRFKSLNKLKDISTKVSSSPYHNAVIKPKQLLAGSQDAPDDATSGHLTSHPRGQPKKPIFCYFGSSANSRPGIGKFWPEHIDPFLCTHLVFAFVDITEDGTGLRPNNWNDLGEKGLYPRTMKLKDKNPDLKILLAVGGWKIGSKPFLPVMKSEEVWKTWVANVVLYLRKYGFDGFDMDWEFPTWRGSGPEDRQKFTLLMKELYSAFAEEASTSGKERLLLTLAAASSAFYAEKSYEQSEIHKYIDYMLLMTYNFHGSGWEKHTGHHSPLLPHPLDPEGEQRELYILWAVKYWLNFGVPKEKIILGLSTYGLGWKLTDISQTGVKAPANGGSSKGKYTDESGILSLYEICENVIQENWKVQWIEEQKVPYAYGGGEWVGFDSPDSFYLKAAVIMKEDLGGAFVWSVEMDDFNGHCGGPKYPLLRTIYEVFTQTSTGSGFDFYKSVAASGHHNPKQSSSAAAKDGPSGSSSEGQHVEEEATPDQPPVVTSTSDDRQVYSSPDKDAEDSNYYPYEDIEPVDVDIFDCNSHGLGIHADPKSCQHFILCMPVGPQELGSSRMNCPSGTLFDEKVKVCNHHQSVTCQH